jgi:predicted DCC family thiol-disulfide oxidoreductase YuxK
VQFILKRDRNNVFHFASLQGTYGQQLLKEQGLPLTAFDTFILVEQGRIYTRSTGVLRIVKALPGGWPLLYPAILIPAFIRDRIYDWVARNRYAWFGKRTQCWLPRPEWTVRFMD